MRDDAEARAAAAAVERRALMRAAGCSLVVGAALLAVKLLAYRWTGSAAILSDALESIANVFAAAFALGGLLFAVRPADSGHPYGHGKIEYLSAAFEGGLITFAAATIVWVATVDLVRGPELGALDLGLALTLAAGLVNAALGVYLVAAGRRLGSITLVADGQHVLSDFKTSVGVVIGLVLVRLTGLVWFDPLAALIVGANLGWTGIGLVRHAAGALLDEEDPALLARLVAACEAERVPGIIRMHRLRAIRGGRTTHADAHLTLPEFWSVEQAHAVVDAFEGRVLATPRIDGEIAFHVDPCHRALCASCDLAGCAVREAPFAGRAPFSVAEARLSDDAFWRAQGLAAAPPAPSPESSRGRRE